MSIRRLLLGPSIILLLIVRLFTSDSIKSTEHGCCEQSFVIKQVSELPMHTDFR
jgi:hypothetical protein